MKIILIKKGLKGVVMTAIKDVEGIGDVFAKKLQAKGINTVEALLEKGATPKGREEVAKSTGIDEHKILEWVNRADLYRIKGIGSEYSDLLEAAGVDTVVELSKRRADNLTEKMVEVNVAKKLVRRVPTQQMVEGWITEAKSLPRIVKY
jgi:predicted flap endonuclease-1-like 5' DNA nuclease